MTNYLSSLQNPQIKMWRALKTKSARQASGLFLAEGEHMTGEALKTGFARTLICEESRAEQFTRYIAMMPVAQAYFVPAHVMEALCDAKTPQGICAVCALPQNDRPLEGRRFVALDGVQDPGNVGTIIRTCDAAGFDGVLLSDACADPYAPKAMRATMGGIFRVPVRTCALAEELPRLREKGITLIASELGGGAFFSRDRTLSKVCLVIGNEGAGISSAVSAACDLHLALPMPGQAESLNAAVAAGIMIYDIIR